MRVQGYLYSGPIIILHLLNTFIGPGDDRFTHLRVILPLFSDVDPEVIVIRAISQNGWFLVRMLTLTFEK